MLYRYQVDIEYELKADRGLKGCFITRKTIYTDLEKVTMKSEVEHLFKKMCVYDESYSRCHISYKIINIDIVGKEDCLNIPIKELEKELSLSQLEELKLYAKQMVSLKCTGDIK